MKDYKVGDIVKINKSFNSVRDCFWNSDMDKYIGHSGEITRINHINKDLVSYLVYCKEVDGKDWFFLPESFYNYRKEKLKKILNEK